MDKIDYLFGEIRTRLKDSPFEADPTHAEIVLKWVKKIKPEADEALQIAALAHDIDRAITGITEKDLVDYSQIEQFKQEHALRSARFISELMAKHGYEEATISRVSCIVKEHEVGGSLDSDILRDADSIAYFEYNIPFYLKRNGRERTLEKIKFMYNRLSEKSKKEIQKMIFEDEETEVLLAEAIS